MRNVDELVVLIDRIKGDRSIRQMSRDTGVTASYISEMLKGRFTPSITTLSRLLYLSQDRNVTLDMLISAATGRTFVSKSITEMNAIINQITPEEIGKHIGNNDLALWCANIQDKLIEYVLSKGGDNK